MWQKKSHYLEEAYTHVSSSNYILLKKTYDIVEKVPISIKVTQATLIYRGYPSVKG